MATLASGSIGHIGNIGPVSQWLEVAILAIFGQWFHIIHTMEKILVGGHIGHIGQWFHIIHTMEKILAGGHIGHIGQVSPQGFAL